MTEGRLPRLLFRGLLSARLRFGPRGRWTAHAALCRQSASVHFVTSVGPLWLLPTGALAVERDSHPPGKSAFPWHTSISATTETRSRPGSEASQLLKSRAGTSSSGSHHSHATPVAADRSAPVLSVILKQAEIYGYRLDGSNPCTGIKRYRRCGRERFLTADEMHRLSHVLDHHRESRPLETSVVRLLLLTGCRKSEILTLKWSEYREGMLHLSDSKTGPRTVWLSSAAHRIFDDLPRSSLWVFPSPRRNYHLSGGTLNSFWLRVRAEAGIENVRCHDLRHTYASVALAHGETILTIGRLLGHTDPATTLKYTHLADATVHEAAEALVPVLGGED